MKHLDDIPKKNIYQVPDGYFEELPQVIQSRVAASQPSYFRFSWTTAVRFALPVFVAAALGLYWWQSNRSIEDQLEKIEVEQLAYFLNDTDLTLEEMTEVIMWSTEDIDALEESVYSTLDTGSEWGDEWMDELDLNM